MNHPVALLVLCLLHPPVYAALPVGAPVLPIPASLRVPQFAAAPVLLPLIAAAAPAWKMIQQLLTFPCVSFGYLKDGLVVVFLSLLYAATNK